MIDRIIVIAGAIDLAEKFLGWVQVALLILLALWIVDGVCRCCTRKGD